MTPISWLQTTDFNPSRWNHLNWAHYFFKMWEMTPQDWRLLEYSSNLCKQRRHTIPFVARQYHIYGKNLCFSFQTFSFVCNLKQKSPLSSLILPILHKWEPLFLLCFVFQKRTYQRRTTDKNQEKITMCCLKCRHSSVMISRVLEQVSQFYTQTRKLRSWRQILVLLRKKNTKNSFFLSALQRNKVIFLFFSFCL